MIKLLKYEFRKSLLSLMILMAVVGAAEVYFIGAMALDSTDHMAYAMAILGLCVYAAMVYVFVRGLTTYSAELKNRSAYLIFMTPNSGLKIMASKYVYTFANGLLIGAISAVLFALDAAMFFDHRGEIEALLGFADRMLRQIGLYMDQLGLFVAVSLLSATLSVLSFFALAYLAITLSHTLLRDKKGRGLIAFVLFVGLEYVVGRIGKLFPSPVEQLVVYVENPQIVTEQQMVASLNELIPFMLPQACVSLVCVIGSLFGCGWMLDKKVSL